MCVKLDKMFLKYIVKITKIILHKITFCKNMNNVVMILLIIRSCGSDIFLKPLKNFYDDSFNAC